MENKSFAVLGLGKFGRSTVEELVRAGAEVMAVDNDEEKVKKISEIAAYAMQADVRDSEAMQELGLSNMDGVIVAMTGSLDASIMATIMAKEEGVPYVLAKAQDEVHERILKRVGADKVIIPERESAARVARNMISGNFLDFIELSERVRMVELSVKPEWMGYSLCELDLRKKYSLNVMAIRSEGELVTNIDPEEKLTADMTLLVTIDKKDLARLYT
jgi:trk system potassium uptake protein TrkA